MGQNPIFLHHCEGAPGPATGEIIAAQKSQAILGSSGTSLPLKNNNNNNNNSMCIQLSFIPTGLLFPIPGLFAGPDRWPELVGQGSSY